MYVYRIWKISRAYETCNVLIINLLFNKSKLNSKSKNFTKIIYKRKFIYTIKYLKKQNFYIKFYLNYKKLYLCKSHRRPNFVLSSFRIRGLEIWTICRFERRIGKVREMLSSNFIRSLEVIQNFKTKLRNLEIPNFYTKTSKF